MEPKSSRKRPDRRVLLAVIAVAIILIALAIVFGPSYLQRRRAQQERTAAVRAQVAQGLALSDPVRLAVTLYLARFHLSPPNNTETGLPFAEELGGKYVRGVQVNDGKIIVTYGNHADALIAGKQIELVPHKDADGVTRWQCSGNDIDTDYLPPDCR